MKWFTNVPAFVLVCTAIEGWIERHATHIERYDLRDGPPPWISWGRIYDNGRYHCSYFILRLPSYYWGPSCYDETQRWHRRAICWRSGKGWHDVMEPVRS